MTRIVFKSSRKGVLVLGGSGFIGRVLRTHLVGERDIATYNTAAEIYARVPGWLPFDLLKDNLTNAYTDEVSHAVVLLGMTNPDSCANNRALSEKINLEGITRILDTLGERQIRCIFASTEVVFDGVKGKYCETDIPNPLLVYGKQKLEIEKYLSINWPSSATVRIAKVYGAKPGDNSLLDNWYQQAVSKMEIRCADDFISSMIHVDDVVKAILAIVDNNLSGTYHLGGPRGISRFEAFTILLRALQDANVLSEVKAVRCSIDEFPTIERRPRNVSLVTEKLTKEAGLICRTIEDSCQEYAFLSQLHTKCER